MLSPRRQIQHWHFSILIIAMYWNLQGIPLQISRDIDRISKEGRQSGQMKSEDAIIKIAWKKRTKEAMKRGEPREAKCCQLKGTKKVTMKVRAMKSKPIRGDIKLMQGGKNRMNRVDLALYENSTKTNDEHFQTDSGGPAGEESLKSVQENIYKAVAAVISSSPGRDRSRYKNTKKSNE